jgi:hypothetical protein
MAKKYIKLAGVCRFCGKPTDDLVALQHTNGGSIMAVAAHYATTSFPVDFLVCPECANRMLRQVNVDKVYSYRVAYMLALPAIY